MKTSLRVFQKGGSLNTCQVYQNRPSGSITLRAKIHLIACGRRPARGGWPAVPVRPYSYSRGGRQIIPERSSRFGRSGRSARGRGRQEDAANRRLGGGTGDHGPWDAPLPTRCCPAARGLELGGPTRNPRPSRVNTPVTLRLRPSRVAYDQRSFAWRRTCRLCSRPGTMPEACSSTSGSLTCISKCSWIERGRNRVSCAMLCGSLRLGRK